MQMAAQTNPQAAPQMQAQMQQMQAQMKEQIPWKAVIGVLQNDLQRAYKIDIETNSTIEPEAAEDQKQIAELMGAIGQFLTGVGPLIQQGVLPFEVAKSMLMAISRRFRFGSIVEDQLENMKPPPPPPQEDKSGEQAAIMQKQTALTAENQQLKTKLAAMDQEKQLAAQGVQLNIRSSDLDVRELALNSEKELFRLEQQRAAETLNSKAQGETQKLEHKRALTGLESRQAKQEQGMAKAVDSKTAQAVGKIEQALSQLTARLDKMEAEDQAEGEK
jgi:hypothetical protein